MKPKIVKANSLKENPTLERCLITENYSTENISIAQARVKPGITTLAHHLIGVNEVYLITSGKGQVDIGDLQTTEVTSGDLIVIPAGVSQRISNIGKTDLVFYCICTPKFTAECFFDEEEAKGKLHRSL
jgi:mannose-6-phosphate isomerase-like protein (cupin superfamily)